MYQSQNSPFRNVLHSFGSILTFRDHTFIIVEKKEKRKKKSKRFIKKLYQIETLFPLSETMSFKYNQ